MILENAQIFIYLKLLIISVDVNGYLTLNIDYGFYNTTLFTTLSKRPPLFFLLPFFCDLTSFVVDSDTLGVSLHFLFLLLILVLALLVPILILVLALLVPVLVLVLLFILFLL